MCIRDSINGIFNLNFWPKSVFVMASEGKMDEKLGIRVTSSKVSESFIIPIFIYIHFYRESNKKLLI